MDIIKDITEFSNLEIKVKAKNIDSSGIFPKNIIQELAERKFLSVIFPKSIGGLELDPISYGLFFEQASKYCSNIKNLFLVSMSMVGGTLLKHGSKQQINYWLPQLIDGSKIGAFAMTEPNIGSDSSNINTTFEKIGSNFKINGSKKWITLGGIADFILLVARANNRMGVFIVETDRLGLEINTIDGLLGNRASHIAEINIENLIIPKENLLGELETGINKVVSNALDIGRYNTAWSGVSLAQACLDEMVSYSRNRSQFGRKIRSFQLIQKLIGDATVNIHAARSLALKAGELRKFESSEAINETIIAKYFSSKIAMRIAEDNIQVHGANGYSDKFPAERYFREAKVLEIIEGSSQILVQIIAKNSIMNSI